MAKRKKSNKKPGRAGKIALTVFVALLLALCALVGVGTLNAGIVRIRRADVALPDLPGGFDGVTVLYASDIDLCGLNTPDRTGKLFGRLQSLRPDILLLGVSPEKLEKRASFFHYISSFDAPMGKFAIASPEDLDQSGLASLMEGSGVRPLFNDRAAIRSGNDTLWIAGICQESASLNSAGTPFDRHDCVLLMAYSPEVLPVLLTSEARDGGPWVCRSS